MNCYTSIGRRSQYLLLFTFTIIGLIFYFLGIQDETLQTTNLRLIKTKKNIAVPGFSVYTPGCRIPEMNPFDKSVLKYISDAPPLVCGNRLPLIESNQTSIWIVTEAFQDYNISDPAELKCCFRKFDRADPNPKTMNSKYVDNIIFFSEVCEPFQESANVFHEFVKVECFVKKKEIYKDFHAFIVPKAEEKTYYDIDEEEVSVLIVGADAVSRLNFYRKMPKTRELLRSLGAMEFLGYNKVQDNTFPNLVPLLSGYSVEEIRNICWFNNSLTFDECPWIWKNFSSQNYYTAFAEESFWMGLFNYGKRGFLYRPTDYYYRPFFQVNEQQIGHKKPQNTYLCSGVRIASEILLNYAYKFSANMTLSNKKFWALFWENSLTHDFLNIPRNVDDLFYKFFESLKETVLNTTVVFFLSDHGMRWGDIRQTYQGRIEEHHPFLYILLPDWFKERYSLAIKNMERNAHLLTTHFDLYETLKDILQPDNLKPENLNSRTEEGWTKRAMSLFLPVSIYRSCKSAGIAPSWCTCQRRKKIPLTDQKVQMAAKFTVNYINKLLSKNKECAKLKLHKILSAYVEAEEDFIQYSTKHVKSDYVIIIVTTPGFAKFEATLRHHNEDNEMVVLGDISRVNVYGSQSKCVSNYQLKLYCYCK